MKNLLIPIALLLTLPAAAGELTPDSCLSFLYRSMTRPDRADYTEEFYRTNVESSLQARREMPWGDSVPDREFMHFVLPVRVNNENLDMSRPVFYSELKERVKGMPMREAILEVNHWCHEKVTYQPSDARTSSPLSSVSQAIGRCGEESTFTVAALRSVGIPARQVYTPRWAHTDDNHAWVEAWADGRWWFLGACEPEAILNLAWFNVPASRGMLMHTAVYGVYDGPEEQVAADPYATVINVTENYAPVAPVHIHAVYPDGTPAVNATADFRLYNYAEFYPLASKQTDAHGNASVTAGKGDLLAWVSDGRRFGYAVANARDTAVVTLDREVCGYRGSDSFTLTPPPPSASLPAPTPAQAALNERRKAYEDSLRNDYTSTFISAEEARNVGKALGLDGERLARLLPLSRGNNLKLVRFLEEAPDREKALRLLSTLCEKDLRDISLEVLYDHLATPEQDSPLFDTYVMSPRVEWEGLTPYKSFFTGVLTAEERDAYRKDPKGWAERFRARVTVDDSGNPKRLRMSPAGVWTTGRADEGSVKIAFVSGARACGIPSRMDPVTGKAQYADGSGRWTDVDFVTETAPKLADTGRFRASETVTGVVPEPKYYSHFSLCRLEGGRPRQLEYPEGLSLEEFKKEAASLETGEYMLVTGQRFADGSVMSNVEFFPVEKDMTAEVPIRFPKSETGVQVIGSLNAEHLYHDAATGAAKSLLSTTGRGYYVLGIIRPNHEPSAHALNDISALRDQFGKRGEKGERIMLLCRDTEELARFDRSRFPELPDNVVIGADIDGRIYRELQESLKLPEGEWPVFVVADTFNRVVHVVSGYTIGMGEQLMSVLRRL